MQPGTMIYIAMIIKTNATVQYIIYACNYAPINIRPHYPLDGQGAAGWELIQHFTSKIGPRGAWGI